MALKLLHNETFPSWGFSIKQGATSIWERWDGWTPEKGFQDPGMNSFAHYSFGAVYQWMVENLGGIRSSGPAYRTIRVEPVFDPRLSWVETSYTSIRGPIKTRWERMRDGGIELAVSVPANTQAAIVVPAQDPGRVAHEPQALLAGESMRSDGKRVILTVGSGRHVVRFHP